MRCTAALSVKGGAFAPAAKFRFPPFFERRRSRLRCRIWALSSRSPQINESLLCGQTGLLQLQRTGSKSRIQIVVSVSSTVRKQAGEYSRIYYSKIRSSGSSLRGIGSTETELNV